MLSDRETIQDKLLKYMTASDYALSPKSKYYHSLSSFVFDYINAGGIKDSIKIEINYSLRSHVMPTNFITMPNTIVSGDFEVNTVSPVEIYATKTVALLTRGAARDLYDMNYMVQNDFFTKEELALYRQCVVFYLAVATETPITRIDYKSMDTITPHKVITNLRPVIRAHDAFDLIKAKETVINFLDENLFLTDKDMDFLENFKLGRYCPEALGDYMAGPNHTLPTGGSARFSSPLSVDDFIKKTQYTYYTRDAFRRYLAEIGR